VEVVHLERALVLGAAVLVLVVIVLALVRAEVVHPPNQNLRWLLVSRTPLLLAVVVVLAYLEQKRLMALTLFFLLSPRQAVVKDGGKLEKRAERVVLAAVVVSTIKLARLELQIKVLKAVMWETTPEAALAAAVLLLRV
jgi:hypothetical protein